MILYSLIFLLFDIIQNSGLKLDLKFTLLQNEDPLAEQLGLEI